MDAIDASDPLIPVFIPALVTLLLNREQQKGAPLSYEEVIQIRDQGVCIMMPTAQAIALDQQRGYTDIDPADCWQQWLDFKA